MDSDRNKANKSGMGGIGQATNDLRVINIKSKLTIFHALDFIGVKLLHGHTTQQIVCPFHDDTKPSARAYGDSNKLFCFTCHKTWDVITVVMDGKQLSFTDTLSHIEEKFNIPSPLENLALTVRYNVEKASFSKDSLFHLRDYVEDQLIERKKDLGLEKYVRLLTALDYSTYYHNMRKVTDEEFRDTLRIILSKLNTGV